MPPSDNSVSIEWFSGQFAGLQKNIMDLVREVAGMRSTLEGSVARIDVIEKERPVIAALLVEHAAVKIKADALEKRVSDLEDAKLKKDASWSGPAKILATIGSLAGVGGMIVAIIKALEYFK